VTSVIPSPLGTVIAAWRGATARHFLFTLLFALAWSGVTIATATGYFTGGVPLTPSINAVLSLQFNGFAVLLAVLVAEHVESPLAPRAWPYVAAVAIGVSIGTTALWLVSQRVFGLASAYAHAGPYEPFASFAFRHGRHAVVVCGLVTFVYVSARRATERSEALHRVQLERAEAEKRLVDETLAATKARVDPAALQATLARIDSLYESGPAQADALLRELIASLRSAVGPAPAATPTFALASHWIP
jgi:hypothetical protein